MSTPDGSPPPTGNAPDRPIGRSWNFDVPEVELTAELADRREAVAELGDALRDLTSRAIGSEVEVDVIRKVAAGRSWAGGDAGRATASSGRAVGCRRPAPWAAPVQSGRRPGQPRRPTDAGRDRGRCSDRHVHPRLALRRAVHVRPRWRQRIAPGPDHGVRHGCSRPPGRDRPVGGPLPLDGAARRAAAAGGEADRRPRRPSRRPRLDQPGVRSRVDARRSRGAVPRVARGAGRPALRQRVRATPRPDPDRRSENPSSVQVTRSRRGSWRRRRGLLV